MVKVKLQVFGATTHCRIRSLPSLSSPEVGDFPAGTVVSVTSLVNGFYRLADGRGYVLKYVEGAITWLRVGCVSDDVLGIDLACAEGMLMERLEASSAHKAYQLLCGMLKKKKFVDNQLLNLDMATLPPTISARLREVLLDETRVHESDREAFLYLLLTVSELS